MTHVVGEACIKCRYTDCVDVLIEAENIENNIKEMDFEGLFNFYY